jgi:hypothetical protein
MRIEESFRFMKKVLKMIFRPWIRGSGFPVGGKRFFATSGNHFDPDEFEKEFQSLMEARSLKEFQEFQILLEVSFLQSQNVLASRSLRRTYETFLGISKIDILEILSLKSYDQCYFQQE